MTDNLHPLSLFLCHSSGDKKAVRSLYKRLSAEGFDPWLDDEKLLPGQDWNMEITAAVRNSDVVIVCLSLDSINKRGVVQREIRYALDVADEQPKGCIFIIPLKLEECAIPEQLAHLHWVNLFEPQGYEQLLASLRAKSVEVDRGRRGSKPVSPVAVRSHHPGGEILRDLLMGLLLVALVLGLKLFFERTTFGERLDSKSQDLLHLPLWLDDMPIAVVDIRDLAPEKFNLDGRTGIATPREPLRQMIEAVAEAGAEAVGLLIDFSPDENGYIHPQDPEFFRFCLDMRRTGVPVFLGIGRTPTARPDEWLGVAEFQDLAAHLLIPKDRRRMFSEIKVEDPWQLPAGGGAWNSRAMSVALADAYARQPRNSPSSGWPLLEPLTEVMSRLGWVEEMSEKSLGTGLKVEEFLIDYSHIDSIDSIRTTNPAVLRHLSRRFEGKVVLIGSASLDREEDLFEVPGRDRKYPGVFLQASAVNTLINPRYEVTWKGRFALDVCFFLSLLSVIVLIRHYRRSGATQFSPRHRGFLITLTTVVAMLVCVAFVRATRMMWDDFLTAPTLMTFHPSIERRLGNFQQRLREKASELFGLASKQNGRASR